MWKSLLLIVLTTCSSQETRDNNPHCFHASSHVTDVKLAMSEWNSYIEDNRLSLASGPSRIDFVDNVCTMWPETPSNAIGCSYALRDVGGVLQWDNPNVAHDNDDAIKYVIEIKNDANARRTALHELGHVLGYCHNPDVGVMSATMNDVEHLTQDDLKDNCANNGRQN